MIFTDSDIISLDSLTQLDSEVSAAAKAAKPPILIEGPGSICEQAWQECGRRILQAMQSYVSYPAQTGMPATHIAAVTNVGVPARTQARTRLNQIVATESQYGGVKSQMELWLAYHALYLFFRDVSARVDKDRYQEKMERYDDVAYKFWKGLRCEGLPMVYQPMEAPGAKHGLKPGTWGTANLSLVGGSGTLTTQIQVAITYCDAGRGYQSQRINGNAESAPSTLASITLEASKVLHVDISSLNPPTGQMDQVGLSQGAWTPLNATHWNLWVGNGSGPLYLQQELIPIATKTATLAGDPVFSGSPVGNGQYPDLNLVFMNIAMRG